jgi:hypothetical protein
VSADEIVGGPDRVAPRPQVAVARVTKAPDPDGWMEVVLVGYSNAHPYDVAPGHYRAPAPVVDSECLVNFDNRGDAWVVC